MNAKKKLLSLGLAVSLAVSALALPAAAETAGRTTFPDVPTSKWYYTAVDAITNDYGLMSGYDSGRFGPEDNLTREQFVTILFNLNGEDMEDYEGLDIHSVFSDVKNNAWYAPFVSWAYIYGITEGLGDGTFGAGKTVTREQMAQFIKNYCNGLDFETDTTVPDFADADAVSNWAKDAVTWSHQLGIFNGDENGRFNPATKTTRAVAAQVFYNFLQNVHVYGVSDYKQSAFTVTEFADYAAKLVGAESGVGPMTVNNGYWTTTYETQSQADAAYYYRLYQETGDKTCLQKRDAILAQQVLATKTSYETCLDTLSLSAIEDGLDTLDAVNAVRANAGLDPYATNLYTILAATMNVDASYHYLQSTGTFTHTMPCSTSGEILALYSSNIGSVQNWYSERSIIVEAVQAAAESEGVDISGYDLNNDNTLYSLAFGHDCAGNDTTGTIPYLSSATWTGTTGHYTWLLSSSDSYTAGAAYVEKMTGVDFSSDWSGENYRYTTDEIRELIKQLGDSDPSRKSVTTYTCVLCGDTFTE